MAGSRETFTAAAAAAAAAGGPVGVPGLAGRLAGALEGQAAAAAVLPLETGITPAAAVAVAGPATGAPWTRTTGPCPS